MLKSVYRLENKQGWGPFTNPTHNRIESNRWSLEFAKVIPWLRTEVQDDIFSQLFDDPTMPPPVVMLPDKDHPHHLYDGIKMPDENDLHKWKVGCKDMEQLLDWFPKSSHDFLRNEGFELVVYQCECDYIHYGKHQLLFCVDHITVLSRTSL